MAEDQLKNAVIHSAEKTSAERRAIIIDWLSVISLIFMFLITPIWACFEPDGIDYQHQTTQSRLLIWLIALNIIPSCLSLCWLIFRYGNNIASKYPIILTRKFRFFLAGFGLATGILIKSFWSHL